MASRDREPDKMNRRIKVLIFIILLPIAAAAVLSFFMIPLMFLAFRG